MSPEDASNTSKDDPNEENLRDRNIFHPDGPYAKSLSKSSRDKSIGTTDRTIDRHETSEDKYCVSYDSSSSERVQGNKHNFTMIKNDDETKSGKSLSRRLADFIMKRNLYIFLFCILALRLPAGIFFLPRLISMSRNDLLLDPTIKGSESFVAYEHYFDSFGIPSANERVFVLLEHFEIIEDSEDGGNLSDRSSEMYETVNEFALDLEQYISDDLPTHTNANMF
mmetsp:Transcript_798/g.843  ORF Transcript_798/g.843 Transcript_798/m.843 type:complete len:224 (-) Transcript_798:83-754(-)